MNRSSPMVIKTQSQRYIKYRINMNDARVREADYTNPKLRIKFRLARWDYKERINHKEESLV